MNLTTSQIKLIKQSWRSLRGIKPALIADIFYSKLFVEQPSLRKMFPQNMEEQYTKLMDMLNSIIIRLDKLEEVHDDIINMAKRHEGYGVKDHHYKVVGEALLWTLQQGLGKEWTKELEEAWSICYYQLAGLMKNVGAWAKN